MEDRIVSGSQGKVIIVNLSDLPSNRDVFHKFETLVLHKKKFLDPDITLEKLACELNVSEGYLSQSINRNSNGNFTNYINRARIKEAKRLFDGPAYQNYTVASIGLESGFNSKASFYRVFKKLEGTTPAAYAKMLKKVSIS